MENVEITVKVNGKEVDLSTISTETFEAVKAVTKKIPVARTADFFYGQTCEPRLILHIPGFKYGDHKIVVIDLETGKKVNSWNPEHDLGCIAYFYKNAQELK